MSTITRAPLVERKHKKRPNVLGHLVLTLMVIYFLVPLWFIVVASTKNAHGLFAGTGGALWFDKGFHLFGNIKALFTYDGGIYLRWLGNSVLYAVVGGLGSTILSVLAGYGFAKYDFPGRRAAFAVLLGAVMVPLTALVIPTFMLLSKLDLTNTVWAVILPSLLNPFGVYLMRVYALESVPEDVIDAARIDGAGHLRTLVQVALPLMRPATITVLLLSVVANWNNYFLPLAVLSNQRLYPLTVGIGVWQGLASSNNGGGTSLWTLIVIGSLVSIIPLVVAFVSLQKYWQGGLSLGSVR